MTSPVTWHEPVRVLPVAQEAKAVVCGAGPAGMAVAIAAARAGARTRLNEVRGCPPTLAWDRAMDRRVVGLGL